jgi:hypothetical protein
MKIYQPDVRRVAKGFAEWINSGNALAKMFLDLTQLTVDLALELRNPTLRQPKRMRNLAAAIDLLERNLAQVQKRKYVRPSREELHRAETTMLYARKIDPIVKRIVRKYPTEPRLIYCPDRSDSPTFSDEPVYEGKRSYDHEFGAVYETFPPEVRMEQFRLLAKHGAFADFRRCALRSCNKHFFPLRSEGRYCSKSCQRTHYMKAPERKKQNAADQKVYYYFHKVDDLKQLAAVNPAHREKYLCAKKALALAERAQKALKGR